MPDFPVADGQGEGARHCTAAGREQRKSATILWFSKENKTRTNDQPDDRDQWRGKPIAPAIGIRRAWRQVVDFGDPKSSGIGDAWGFKTVSVPWVSILDGAMTDDGSSSQ